MADVLLTLLVLKTRQVEQLRRFYQTLDVEMAEEQHGDFAPDSRETAR